MATKKIIMHPIVDGTPDTTTNLYPKTVTDQVDGLDEALAEKGSATDVAANTAARHTHTNKAILDAITVAPINATMDYSEMPSKGQLITMELGNDTPIQGTNNLYRVLKRTGTEAVVMAMFDVAQTSASTTYSASPVRTALNTTWYSSLSDTAKAAIVASTITQYSYTYSSTACTSSHVSFADYSTKSTISSMTDYIYALDVEDIETYFNHTFTQTDFCVFFFNQTSQPSGKVNVWLRSQAYNASTQLWVFYTTNRLIGSAMAGSNYVARPAFKIDLSKISWS